MKYKITNISKSIKGRSNRKNTFADFSYRVGQMWKRVRLAPDKSIEFSAHQLDMTSRVLEKEGAIKIEIITDSPITTSIGNAVAKVIEKVEETISPFNEVEVVTPQAETIIIEESALIEPPISPEIPPLVTPLLEETKEILGDVKLKKGRKKLETDTVE